jgi:hypothetical protein
VTDDNRESLEWLRRYVELAAGYDETRLAEALVLAAEYQRTRLRRANGTLPPPAC